LWNESFFSAPQLKRDPLDSDTGCLDAGMLLNRCAILVTPKQPYIDWANSLDTDEPRFSETEQGEGPPIFLGPDLDSMEEAEAFVHENFGVFFEHWLEMWCTDDDLWPERRTLDMFKAWFAVRIHSMVVDTVDAPLALE